MSWNYRVIHDGGCYEIHEVFYDKAGNPHSWSESAIAPSGDDIDGLTADLALYCGALTKPVLRIENNKLVEEERDMKSIEDCARDIREAVRKELIHVESGAGHPSQDIETRTNYNTLAAHVRGFISLMDGWVHGEVGEKRDDPQRTSPTGL